MDPDNAPQNGRPHLRSKLFDNDESIYTSAKILDGSMEFLQFLKEKNRRKYKSACKENLIKLYSIKQDNNERFFSGKDTLIFLF